jgi:RNA polymerase sigma-70 factor (ECF subfamily)
MLLEIAKGKHEALAALFARKARMIRAAIRRILRDDAEAEDTLQDVFLEIWKKASTFDSTRGDSITWIRNLAYSRALDRRRHLKARGFYTSGEIDENRAHVEATQDPFTRSSLEETFGTQQVARFQNDLSPEQFQTLQLFFFDGYTLKEIAVLTDRPLVNVRSQYYRGLERIRRIVFKSKKGPK